MKPLCPLMTPSTVDRPSPVPLPNSLVVKNGSKILSITSAGMPLPVSSTVSRTCGPSVGRQGDKETRRQRIHLSLSPCLLVSLSDEFVGRADGQPAAVGHGVAGVDCQVHQHLVQ